MTDMVWIDLETTGLDALTDVPLEIALVVTDHLGNEKEFWTEPIYEYNSNDYQSMLGVT
jgi:oligoribonuclease (3'-5' exoribonuclease)